MFPTKRYYSLIFLTFFLFDLFSQKSIRFHLGLNYTNIKSSYIQNNQKLDDHIIYDWIALPQYGLEYFIPIKDKITFNTGIGLSFMGCKNFMHKRGGDSINEPFKNIIYEYIEKNPDLKINYLKIPIQINYKIKKRLEFYFGYSFNYVLSVNQNLFFVDVSKYPDYVPTYFNKNYFHVFNLGLRYVFFKHYDFSIGGILPLSKMADTEYDWSRFNRYYLNMYGIQMSIGYLIF